MSDVVARVQTLRDRLAKARALKRIIRDAPDRLSRDEAIIAYSRTLDQLVDDLGVLEDTGLLATCTVRLTKWDDDGTAF